MSIERFYTADIPDPGHSVALTRTETHHLRHVKRLKTGREVFLLNGRGTLARGTVRDSDSKAVFIDIIEKKQIRKPSVRTILALAFPDHKDVLSDVIRGAVELGVSDIHLIRSAFSGVRRSGDIDKVLERCRRVVLSAGKQCGQLWFPEVSGVFDLETYLNEIPGNTMVYCGFEPGATADATSIDGIPVHDSHIVWLVGPEGGWSAEELKLMHRVKICTVRLGERTMTTRIAAIAGLSALLTRLNRW